MVNKIHSGRVYAAVAAILATAAAGAQDLAKFDVPPQALAASLRAVGSQASVNVLFDPPLVEGRQAPALKAKLTSEQAFSALLAGSGLRARYLDSKTVMVVSSDEAKNAAKISLLIPDHQAVNAEDQGSSLHIAQAESTQANLTPIPDVIQEITVTARRREESIKDVPLSIVAKSGDDLEKLQIEDVSELARVVPGLYVSQTSGDPQVSYSLRGVGTFSGSTGVDSAVGVAVDGAVMPFTGAFSQAFSDLERVEVLKGPQGTLFGKNSSAGLISYTTKDPTKDFTGNAAVEYGSYNEIKLNGTLSGALVPDILLARVSFFGLHRDGYLKDIQNGTKFADDSQRGIRLTLLSTPVEGTRLRLSSYWMKQDPQTNLGFPAPIRSLGPLSPPSDFQYFGNLAGTKNVSLRTSGIGHDTSVSDTKGSIFEWDQKLGDYTLTSITSYIHNTWNLDRYFFSDTPAPSPFFGYQVYEDKEWTQELRIASPSGRRIDYQAGLYALGERHEFDFNLTFPPTPPALGPYLLLNAPVTTHNYAAFGELNFHLTDQVTLIAGARRTTEKKSIVLDAAPAPAGYTGLLNSANPGVTRDSIESNNWSWRGGLQWKMSPDLMVYATASRGFKGGGFNNINFTQGTSQKVQPEIATTYEIGAKTWWLEHKLSADIAIYNTSFKDLQLTEAGIARKPDGTLYTLPDGTFLPAYFLENAGALRSRGAEFQIEALPLRGLQIDLAGSYVDAVYTDYRNAGCYTGQAQYGTGCTSSVVGGVSLATQNLTGTQLPFSHKLSFSAGTAYSFALGRLPYDMTLSGDYVWHSKTQYDNSNAPQGIEGSIGLLNGAISIRDKSARYELTLYGKNLTNKFHVIAIGGGTGVGGYGTTDQVVPPDYQRIYGAMFKYTF